MLPSRNLIHKNRTRKNLVGKALTDTLWKIYHRTERPKAWAKGGNLPWNEPDFSERMLREHLDDAQGAATRAGHERQMQLEWFWSKLGLEAGMTICDLTCGPGFYAVELAKRGCTVVGVDFSPASTVYANHLAEREGVDKCCTFIEKDILQVDFAPNTFDAILFIYGQFAIFPKTDAQMLLAKIAQSLKPGGKLCVELLDPTRIDRTDSQWWFTDDSGLWGDAPFLHLGERFWDEVEEASTERFYIVHLESGQLTEITLCDQSYGVQTMKAMMEEVGFNHVDIYPQWDGLPLYDREEWVVYIAER